MNISKMVSTLYQIESVVNEDVDSNMEIKMFVDRYSNIPVVESSIFPADSVPVRQYDKLSETTTRYGVASDILSVFMERNNITNIKQALDAIGEANGFSGSEITIELPGNDKIQTMISEAKKEPNIVLRNEKFRTISRMGKLLDTLNTTKVPVAKEKSGVTHINFNSMNIQTKETTGIGSDFGDDSKHQFKE